MNNTEALHISVREPTTDLPRRIVALLTAVARDLLYLLAVFCMSIVAFVVWIAGVSVTAPLLILIVGFLVWVGTAYAVRTTAMVDRRLAGWLLRRPIPGLYRQPPNGGLWARVETITRDLQTWKDCGWLVLDSVLGFVLATATMTFTALVFAYIVMPLWWWAIPDPHHQYATLNLGIYTVTSTGWAFLTTALGLALTPLALVINHGAAKGHAALAASILGPSERQRLNARVQELASSRADVVEAGTEQLERIERDLHDGAQARLVALAMELGMAEEELSKDPDAARETVRKARHQALSALGELRDLSRGLRPALLEDRGLATAIEDLAHRAPLPVTLTFRGDIENTPDTIQTAAYFVVAEALTNAAKHSGAASVRVSVQRTETALDATIVDDGKGGANAQGAGLAGLRKRVRALDGRLELSSPPGGPTSVKAEIPCG
ncbi:MAG: sensor histidine kinase [Solirubrobacterales bacterium]|nr:sensor histidine kinase [Solirubrobacterales bacterium]MBV9473689.1 sensor histidine kinase [Solirubrobacterales bacterium]MBV9836960.1 sensor histidine kinase [Solirubrobacterales bacterium]